MRQLPEPTSVRWLTVGTSIQRVRCLTRVHHWLGHFDFASRMKYRCQGAGCPFCDGGRLPEVYYVIGVQNSAGERFLLELRARHYPIAKELNEHESEGVGWKIQIYRAGTAKNSPIEIELLSWEAADEWDICRLVDSIGNTLQRRSGVLAEGQQDRAISDERYIQAEH